MHIGELSWMRRPMFSHLHQVDIVHTQAISSPSITINVEGLPASAESLTHAAAVVCDALAAGLATALALPREDIDKVKAVHSLRVDSLMAIEVPNWFAKEVKAEVAVFEILGNGSMVALVVLATEKSFYVSSKVKEKEMEQEGRW